jgi:hypothetical protein
VIAGWAVTVKDWHGVAELGIGISWQEGPRDYALGQAQGAWISEGDFNQR